MSDHVRLEPLVAAETVGRRESRPWLDAAAHRAGIVALVIVLAGLMADAFAQGWPVKRFEVLNVEPGRHLEVPGDNPLSSAIEFFLEGLLEILQDTGAFDPDLPGWFETVDLHPEAAQEMEHLLNGAARLLEQWGFRPPALVPVVDTPDGDRAFRVYLVEDLVGAFGHDDGIWGVYHGSLGGGIIMLSAVDALSNGRLSDRGAMTLVHELFHAVQHGSPFFARRPDGSVGDWIMEGTADAVAAELVRLLRNPTPDIVPATLHGRRTYSRSLPIARERNKDPEAYRTASFWRYLAEAAAVGSPGPALAPADFSVLATMFEVGPVGRDCDGAYGSLCESELAWIDAQLRSLFQKPLREMYALFVQAYAQYGEPWGRLSNPTDTWRSTSFAPCERVVFRKHDEPVLGGATGIVHHSVPLISDVGTACFVVTPRGYAEDVRVVVRVDDPTGALPLEDLTAGVEGAPMVAVAADVEEVGANGGATTAAWTFDFQAGETTAFFLTNVADAPAQTTALFDLQVTFTVVEEYAAMAASAGGSAAPSLVFDALPFEFGRVRQADVIPALTELQERAGLVEPCAVRFVMVDSATGDALEIAMDHEGPIVPGTFDIVMLDEGRFEPPEQHPGAAVVTFGIGAANPMSQGDAQAYGGQVGTLTFDAFTRDVVQGSLTVLGKRSIDGRYVGDVWRDYPDELETVAVAAAFRLVPRLPADPLGSLSIESCLHPDPSRRVTPVPPPPIGGDPIPPEPTPVLEGDPETGDDERPAAAGDDEQDDAAGAAAPDAAEPEDAPVAGSDAGSVHPLECRPMVFVRGAEFGANPDLPFVFEHPEGWIHTRIDEGVRARGTFVPPEPVNGAIEYTAERLTSDSAVAMAAMLRSAWEELAVVDYGGEAVVVHGGAMGETLIAVFAVPIEGGALNVQFMFMAPRGCDLVLAEALRELFLGTLRPRR
jgi:hypothetical protein